MITGSARAHVDRRRGIQTSQSYETTLGSATDHRRSSNCSIVVSKATRPSLPSVCVHDSDSCTCNVNVCDSSSGYESTSTSSIDWRSSCTSTNSYSGTGSDTLTLTESNSNGTWENPWCNSSDNNNSNVPQSIKRSTSDHFLLVPPVPGHVMLQRTRRYRPNTGHGRSKTKQRSFSFGATAPMEPSMDDVSHTPQSPRSPQIIESAHETDLNMNGSHLKLTPLHSPYFDTRGLQSRFSSDDEQNSVFLHSPTAYESTQSLSPTSSLSSISAAPPKSPRTGRILHEIPHVWQKCHGSMTKQCAFCRKALGFFSSPEKCGRCKIRVHAACKNEIPQNACGLTPELIHALFEQYIKSDEGGWATSPSAVGEVTSPSSGIANSRSMPRIDELQPSDDVSTGSNTVFPYPPPATVAADLSVDSSSSTNSSAPSTPAHYHTGSRAMTAPPHSAVVTSKTATSSLVLPEQFVFPDGPDLPHIREPTDDVSPLIRSEDSDMTIKISSQGSHALSQGSDGYDDQAGIDRGDSIDRHDSQASTSTQTSQQLMNPLNTISVRNRSHWSRDTLRGPSTSWRDVTIPFSEISFMPDSLLGVGRFGPVHRGYWHQDIAVKFLNMNHVNDDATMLTTFKHEVDSFRNTRHDNIVLFLGYCLDPPKLGIVMNLCKGRTLYNIIHRNRDRMDIQKAVNIAQQVTQGMSYLHQRQIVHRDLRTKNIFVEPNNKIMITDFGLFSMQRLRTAQMTREEAGNPVKKDKDAPKEEILPINELVPEWGKYLHVPERWLCYIAPEIARAIHPLRDDQKPKELPFSFASDAYAFGTVWYELLVGDFPFNKLPAHTILWQVSRGIKPSLNNLQGPNEIKDILCRCWSFTAADRPKFDELFRVMERMPKRRLARSPSHPVQLSRSAESMF